MCNRGYPSVRPVAVRIQHRNVTRLNHRSTGWVQSHIICVISAIPTTRRASLHAYKPDIEHDTYARNPGGVMRIRAIVIVSAILVFAGVTNLYIYARSAYTDGLLDGYRAGEAQGKLEALVELQQWQYQHKCQTTLDAYVSFKMWRDENGYRFDCLVK